MKKLKSIKKNSSSIVEILGAMESKAFFAKVKNKSVATAK
jgi:hypothetical protein